MKFDNSTLIMIWNFPRYNFLCQLIFKLIWICQHRQGIHRYSWKKYGWCGRRESNSHGL